MAKYTQNPTFYFYLLLYILSGGFMDNILNNIPIEIRNQFKIAEKDPLEIYVNDSSIILKKYEPNCIFCGSTEDLVEFKDKLVCKKCSKELNILHEEK